MGKFAVTQEEIDAMKPSLDNLSYTSYMVRVAYDESEVEVLAAVLSCAYSYEVIAKKIVANRPESVDDPFYGDWIRGYASDEYAAGNVILIETLDRLSRTIRKSSSGIWRTFSSPARATRDGFLADGMGDETVSEKTLRDRRRRGHRRLCARKVLEEDDAVVFCDSASSMEALGVKPALIVGDFDSHCNPHLDVETIVLPCEKDDTDTVFAVKTMVQRGYDVFLLIGVIGARLDHTLGNVSILLYLDSLGKKAEIVDDYSEMQIVSKDEVSIEDKYPFFSLLNITGCARGITIRDAKYPLDGAEITCEYQYGVSNEVLPGKTAKISVRDGKLLLIKILQTVSETKKATDRRPAAAFCCVWIVISRWEATRNSMSLPPSLSRERAVHREVVHQALGGIDAVAVPDCGQWCRRSRRRKMSSSFSFFRAHRIVADDGLPVAAPVVPAIITGLPSLSQP